MQNIISNKKLIRERSMKWYGKIGKIRSYFQKAENRYIIVIGGLYAIIFIPLRVFFSGYLLAENGIIKSVAYFFIINFVICAIYGFISTFKHGWKADKVIKQSLKLSFLNILFNPFYGIALGVILIIIMFFKPPWFFIGALGSVTNLLVLYLIVIWPFFILSIVASFLSLLFGLLGLAVKTKSLNFSLLSSYAYESSDKFKRGVSFIMGLALALGLLVVMIIVEKIHILLWLFILLFSIFSYLYLIIKYYKKNKFIFLGLLLAPVIYFFAFAFLIVK